MQREAKAYLWDIAKAAASIREFTAGKDLDVYLKDEMLRAAVERKFGIIGEGPLNYCGSSRSIATRSRWLGTSSRSATKSFTAMQSSETTWCGR